MANTNSKWRFAVDRGGTFTDVVGLDPDGNFHTLKLLSSSPDYRDPSIEGISRVLGLNDDQPLPYESIEAIRFGTTVATNALLERKGGKVALFITKGFSDLLEIGYQSRPDIFSLCIKKPSLLYSMVFEVDERIDQSGNVVKKIDLQRLEEDIERVEETGVDAIAVVFMHSWRNPEHELLCEEVLRRHGLSNVFPSHRTMNLIKIVTRGQSAVVDAYLSPVIAQYLDGTKRATGEITIEFIQSSGGLIRPDSFKGKDAIFSGPAGGVIALAKVAEEMGLKGAIGFDMGGTSTDVSRYEGEFERMYEQVIGGVELQIEMLNIVTVASGGGSILWFDGQRMRVGPESAGADPGPACYGFGGPLTITDANLLTGRIALEYFPKTFGPDRNSSLNMDIVNNKFHLLTEEINSSTNRELTSHEVALGFLRIANEKMALAIKEISVSKGFDVRDYALVCFGGAGGQHACHVATILDIERIIFHPLSGVMSAYGIGLSKQAKKSALTVLKGYNRETHEGLSGLFERIEGGLFPERRNGGKPFSIKREIDLRPKGADTFLTVEYVGYEEILKIFKERYERLFGFSPEDTPLEVVNLRVEVQESGTFFSAYTARLKDAKMAPAPLSSQNIYYSDGQIDVPVFLRDSLPPMAKIKGPAFVVDRYSTLIIDSNFEAQVDENGIIIVTGKSQKRKPISLLMHKPDPILLEVFNNLFMGIATEMGHTLRNTAHSVNIKERLDFSCAIFDGKGDLVANAPHIPVHLGSMADTVKAIIEAYKDDMMPGDIYLTNSPYHGGSHLPDLTVVCPVFSEGGEIIFFTASRGHHADIGGITPGSIPPTARNIDEEGILIDGVLIVRNGVFREEELREILSNHRYPVRNIKERISDLKAQVASCHKGIRGLKEVVDKYGWDVVKDYMGYIQENGSYSVKKALYRFLKGGDPFEAVFEDHLDDSTPIKARITITGGANPPETVRVVIDFIGTGPQHRNDNLNTPLSVTHSAILYVLRALTDTDIPLNSGCLKPVDIRIPEGTILNPTYPSPVASGNVETSQRIVDVFIGILKLASASQGTMNNLLFEVKGDVPYYETIAGGSGAMKGCPGASGVQVHMTNTRITDPEVLEYRHPGVRLERFTLRRGSGGKGLYPGGDGVIREIKFLRPATVSIVSERRVYAPYGLEGGESGKRGVNLLRKANGETLKLPHRVVLGIKKGDSIVIETPGGGGFGKTLKRPSSLALFSF